MALIRQVYYIPDGDYFLDKSYNTITREMSANVINSVDPSFQAYTEMLTPALGDSAVGRAVNATAAAALFSSYVTSILTGSPALTRTTVSSDRAFLTDWRNFGAAGSVPVPDDRFTALWRNIEAAAAVQTAPASSGGRSSIHKMSHLWQKYDLIASYYKTIGDVFNRSGFQKTPEEDMIGIELENELLDTEISAPSHSSFFLSSDNSLRNRGVEYVLRSPLSISTVRRVTKDLLERLQKCKPNNTTRASTHIHFDITKMTYSQLLCFVSSYFFVEELLSHFCGEERQNNLFCQRLIDSKMIISELVRELDEKTPFSVNLYSDSYRYSALNFAAVKKFGSLEFRMFPAVSDTKDLDVWIDTLNSIRLFSLKFATLKDLSDYLIKENASVVIAEMLGENRLKYILKKIKRSLDDKEVLGWSRSAFCCISSLFDAWKDIPTVEELEKARLDAEEDEIRLEAIKKAKEEASTEKKAKQVFVFPLVSIDDVADQISEAILNREVNPAQRWQDE